MEVVSDYIAKNEDIKRFIDSVSDNTGSMNMKQWIENLRENRQLFKEHGWATKLQGNERGRTAVIMGASPAIQNQVEQLRQLQEDRDFVLCGLSSNLEYLLNNGIQPKYIITVDGDKSQGEFFDTIDMDKTKDIVLFANIFAYPPMLRKWKGPLYFIGLGTSDKKFRKKQTKWYGDVNGVGVEFPSLMAQFNIITATAFLILECPIIIFVGHELSFKDDNAKYYVDRKDSRDQEPRFPHGDIYGNIVHTTMGLLAVKYSLEGF